MNETDLNRLKLRERERGDNSLNLKNYFDFFFIASKNFKFIKNN